MRRRTRPQTNNRPRTLALFVAAGALSLVLAGCGQASGETGSSKGAANYSLPQSIQDSGTLRVAATLTVVPFSQKEGTGASGLIPDLAEAVADRLDVEIQYVDMPLSSHVPALQSNRVDMSWSVLSDTEEREGVVDLIPYLQNRSTPIVADGNPHGVQALEDLCGLRVGTVRGGESFQAMEVMDKETCQPEGNPLDLRQYEKNSDALVQIQSGNLDAFLGLGLQLKHVAETYDDGNAYDFVDTTVQGKELVLAVDKSQPELSEAVAAALADVVESGDYEQILAKYDATTDALAADDVKINPLSGS